MISMSTNADPIGSGDFRSYARLGYIAVGLVFGAFGGWAAMAPLDSAAHAPARVAVDGDRKPIQHLEGGIVREILVRDAQMVEEGQVLFRLQPTQAQANTEALRKQIDQAMALEARLIAERDGAASVAFPMALTARRHVAEAAQAMSDQQRQFEERRRLNANQVAILKTRIDQTTRDLDGRERRLTALRQQAASFAQELESVTGLSQRGYYPRNKVLGLERERSRVEGEIGSAEGEMAKLREVLIETKLQVEQIDQRLNEEVNRELTDVRGRLGEARERLAIAEDVLYRVDVRSPRRGIVLGLKVQTAGMVVGPGAVLAEVVPADEQMVLSARVSPLDVQSVAIGQRAEIRFPGLSTRQAPTIFGEVRTVSADSLIDDVTREPYFSARVVMDRAQVPEAFLRTIVPGMPADVLITTGERTMLDYLIGPLRDAIGKAMRER
jgi:HlyD family secretion protein